MTTQADAPPLIDRRLAQEADQQRNTRIALKAAVGGTLAFAVVNLLHIEAASFGPIMIFLLMGLFADDVLRAGIYGMAGTFICGWVATFIAYVCLGQPVTFVALMLLLVGAGVLYLDKAPLFAIVGPILASAMMIQYIFNGADAAQAVRNDFFWLMVVGTIIAVTVDRLMWPGGGKRGFLDRFALCCQDMVDRVENWRIAVHRGKTPSAAPDTAVVADLADMWELAGHNATHPPDRPEPKHELAQHCRRLILRRALMRRCMIMGRFEEWDPGLRTRVVDLIEPELACLRRISDAAARHEPAPSVDPSIPARLDEAEERIKHHTPEAKAVHRLMARVIVMLLRHVYEDCETIAKTYNRVLAGEKRGTPEAAAPLFAWPSVAKPKLIRSLKVMIVIFILLMGELFLDLPGSSQVAFFGVFFAITANLGMQNERTLLAGAGILSAIAYTLLAIAILSHIPHQTLALGFLFLAFFGYMYVAHASKRFSFGALHGGLGLCFAYPTFPGPVWSLATIETRFSALIVAGAVALLFHALLWPNRPLDQVRSSVVKTLHDAADRLDQTRRDARDPQAGKTESGQMEGPLAQVAPQLAELLHHTHFASISRGSQREAWYADVLELQYIVGAVTILHHEVGRLDHRPATDEMLADLDTPWRQSVDALHTLADRVAESPSLTHAAVPSPDELARVRQGLVDSTPDPGEDLDRARMIFVVDCLEQIATSIGKIQRRHPSGSSPRASTRPHREAAVA
ncbi:MAG: hypothetical protein AAGB29_15090 [Planctomycetota bacterium]